MRPRRLVVALAALGAAYLARRRATPPREHVDVYFDDGSIVFLEDGPREELLAVARAALAPQPTT